MKNKLSAKSIERGIYIILIVILGLYGLKDSEAATRLIQAVHQAFSLLNI